MIVAADLLLRLSKTEHGIAFLAKQKEEQYWSAID
jgi:hypothetical protein